jgi:hypothetical protein
MNATDFLQKRSKINDDRGYPTAHNGLVAGFLHAVAQVDS